MVLARADEALLSNSRVVTVFNLPLAVVAGWLLWRSLDWPLVGDATIFHFIVGQMKMGAVPYKHAVDLRYPRCIHAAVVAIGGMSDVAWRVFDLTAAAVMSAFILLLVGPAGRAVAILAMLAVLAAHLLHSPYAAGQRDFLMSIPAVAAALVSATAAEDHKRRWLYLLLAGAFTMPDASIKPSGILLLFLPALATRLHWREMILIVVGAAGVAFLVFGTLAVQGGLGAFVTSVPELLPLYASIRGGPRSVPAILTAVAWMAPIGGLAVAAALGIAAPKPPRVRVIIGLTAFGMIHLLAQRKGWTYHFYPLAVGLACWGAWTLAALPTWRAFVCLIVIASGLGWLRPDSFPRFENDAAPRASLAMQSALESRLPRGARVQMLDSDSGAFLAMARAGMRQATPHIQWFSLLFAKDSGRREFLAALEADPPAAIFLTNDQWPKGQGFEAADNWPEFMALLTSHY